MQYLFGEVFEGGGRDLITKCTISQLEKKKDTAHLNLKKQSTISYKEFEGILHTMDPTLFFLDETRLNTYSVPCYQQKLGTPRISEKNIKILKKVHRRSKSS